MRFRTRSGLAIGYRTRGAGDVIAFLHPIGTRAEFWTPVVERLSDSYRAIAIDARGHGESDVPNEPFSLEQIAADCVELLQTLAVCPVVVVGCSMGGALAQGIAIASPEIVRGLVLANCSGVRSPGSVQALEERASKSNGGMPLILEETIARWFSPAFMVAHPDVVTRVRGWLLEADPVVHGWAWRAMANRKFSSRLDEIRAPTLAVCGSLDRSSPPSAMHALAAAIRGTAYAELAGAGHFAPLEQPQEFAALLRDFIGTLMNPK